MQYTNTSKKFFKIKGVFYEIPTENITIVYYLKDTLYLSKKTYFKKLHAIRYLFKN